MKIEKNYHCELLQNIKSKEKTFVEIVERSNNK